MPSTAFVDETVREELKKYTDLEEDTTEDLFPEHDFLATCLKIGLRIEDLKILTYVDVSKILISFCGKDGKKNKGTRLATQEEINDLVARM